MSCSSKACDWTTGRKRSHSNSIQLTDKWADVSHSSGRPNVIVESALRSCKARSSWSSSSTRLENKDVDKKTKSPCEKNEKVVVVSGSRGLQKTAARLTARRCDIGLTLRHIGVVAGNKAYKLIVGYSAAVCAYYRHIQEDLGKSGRKVWAGKEGKGRGRKEGKKSSVRKPR